MAQVLNREMFMQIRDEISGQQESFVEIMPDVKARVVQLTAEAGYALIAMVQNEKGADGQDLDIKDAGETTYKWVCACVVDEQGNQIFQPEDLKALPFELVQRLARVVNRVNGLSDFEGVKEAEKN